MEAKAGQVESVYMEKRVFDPPKAFVEEAHIKSMEEYKALYRRSIEDPQNFWAEMGEEYLDCSRNGTGRWKNIVLKMVSIFAISSGES